MPPARQVVRKEARARRVAAEDGAFVNEMACSSRIDRLRLVKRTLYEQQRCVYARNQPFRLDYKTAAQRPERVRLAWECGRV